MCLRVTLIMIGGVGLYGLGSSLFSRSMRSVQRVPKDDPRMLLRVKCRWMPARLVETIKLSSSRRRRRRNGVSGAARKVANGVARGANTPLAVEKQSGDRSGDRSSLAVALTREAGLGGERTRRAAVLLERTGSVFRREIRPPRLELRGSGS